MPTQIAPQLNSAPVAASAAPAVLPAKPPQSKAQEVPVYRIRQFMGGVGERLRTDQAHNIPEAQTLQAIRTERQALAAALDSHEFRHALATAYQQAFSSLVPSLGLSLDAAHLQTDQIIAHRVADAQWLAKQVTNEEFLKGARAAASVAPSSSVYQLPPEKVDEMIARFTAFPEKLGPDATAHIDQNMRGEAVGHMALAQAFARPELQALLTQKLVAQNMSPELASRLSSDWMEARRKPAQATAEVLSEGGIVYRTVMEKALAQNPAAASHHGATTNAAANDNPPQAVVQHIAHNGVAANPEQKLVMNV